MTQEISIQDQLQEAMEAETKGIVVDWKAMCVQTYNAAMGEIQRLKAELDGDEVSNVNED